MRKKIWISFSIFILIIIISFGFTPTYSTGYHYFGGKTRCQMDDFELVLDVFLSWHDMTIQPSNNLTPVQINEYLTDFLICRTNDLMPKIVVEPFYHPSLIEGQNIYCRENVCVDRWGTPYHIYIDRQNVNRQKSGLNSVTNEFIMWSCGSNKSNEFGLGDDINSWESFMANYRRRKRCGKKVYFWRKWLDFYEDKFTDKYMYH